MTTARIFIMVSDGTTEDTTDYGKAYLSQGTGWSPAEFASDRVEFLEGEGDEERERFFTALRKVSRKQSKSK